MLVGDAHHRRNVSLAPARGPAGVEHAAHQRSPARDALQRACSAHCRARSFLDLYAGSGAVGLEALSRGAACVAFVERAPSALKVLNQNLARLGIGAGIRVHAKSVSAFLRSASGTPPKPGKNPEPEKYEVVFLDPPYDETREYAATLGLLGGAAHGILAPGAVVIAEHRRKQQLDKQYGKLNRTRLLEQGDAALSFYAASSGTAAEP